MLHSGDLIVAVDDKEVNGVRDVLEAIGLEAGRTLELRLLRGDTTLTVHLTTAPETEVKPLTKAPPR